MTARFLLLFLILFSTTSLRADRSEIDSLELIIDGSQSYEGQINALKELINLAEQKDYEKVEPYLEDLLEIALKSEDNKFIAEAYNLLGLNAYQSNRFAISTSFYFKGLNIIEEEDIEIIAELNHNIGQIFQKQGKHQEAIPHFEESEKFYRGFGDSAKLAFCLNNIGVNYEELGDIEQALKYQNESFALNKRTGDKLHLNFNNLASLFIFSDQPEKSLDYATKALMLNYVNHDTLELAHNLLNIGIAYIDMKQFYLAADSLKRGLELIKKTNFIDEKRKLNLELHHAYTGMNNSEKAQVHLNLTTQLADSLYKIGQIKAMSELETQFSLAQTEKEIEVSKNEILRQRLQTYYMITALVLAAIAIYLLSRVAWMKRKSERNLLLLNQEVQEKNDEINIINLNLEAIIETRTHLIKDQKERIRQYAFTNSHNLRGPLSRIMGLIDLILPEKDLSVRDEMVLLIKKSTHEMDEVITNVSRHLEDDDI